MMHDRSHTTGGRYSAFAGLAALGTATIVAAMLLVPAGENRLAVGADGAAPYRPDKHAPVDPIKANGSIFVDWPKPDVVFLFSGEQEGYLEPCGCAGLNNQKGGLKRRQTLIKELEAKGWPVVSMDVGGQVKRFGAQSDIKFRYAIESLVKIGYEAIGFGPKDLKMDILSVAINLDEDANPFVSANVGIAGFDSGFTKRFKIIEKGGVRIGVTGVLGKQYIADLKQMDDVELMDPSEAIRQVLPELRKAECDQLVLLSFASPEESREFARQFPEFNWVVTAEGAEEPPAELADIEGSRGHVVEVAHKGMYVVAVGIYKSGPKAYRYQRVPLDSRFKDSPEMQAMLVTYQRELQTLGLENLGLRPLPYKTQQLFAGSEICGDCHTSAMEVFQNTPHAHATDSLVHLTPPRQYDPECLSCHVTGWEPQKYFPFVSGYLSLEATPQLVGNGCENCHGPAAKHAAVEGGELDASEEEQERLRAALRLTVVENEGNRDKQVFGSVVQGCVQCHDVDNSPDFDFQAYWPEVAHEGKD